ncbi:tRNA (adenosine(37)-N6)-dimethylallyltransferase MiaA [Pseudozobellia thermophila]|uniref:tRNA dimethylallyltransferase n=1 Tax=Pseudozobellia thermophila TaxID=192903 RepID=A0A1M6F8L7_9FLAO|nr:tRNA (adenosine(37)-N6)-dimethylallyltransferase MiaA [Pseudozobellia thermophila]SHI94094.1 tRNA dimethylallyltransferase [Pseudozobellia thermophila]
MEKTLISVIGPTAIGKTKLAIELARHFDTEIISSDSRQFYKEMGIGTAVPSREELAMAKHHFIQHKSIHEAYSVGDFERDALSLLDRLFEKKDIVIMVGGSGLYVDAVTKGLNHFPKIDKDIRTGLNRQLREKGIESLQEELRTKDPVYYKKVDLANPHRLIRALEVCIGTGLPYSSFLNKETDPRPFKTISIGLTSERETLYHRINKRVDMMVDGGLIEEARGLIPYQNLNALQTVGYRELFNYFKGEWSLDFALSEIKKNTRRFAKRQITWFKKNEQTHWYGYKTPTLQIITDLDPVL